MAANHLLAIDDLELAEINIEPAMLTNQSQHLGFGVRRREGISGSVFMSGAPEPAVWNVLLRPPNEVARDALLATLGGSFDAERRLLGQIDDLGNDLVVTYAALREITPHANGLDLFVDFESADSVWLALAATDVTKTFTSPLDQSVRVTVPGNAPTTPIVTITPTAQRTTATADVGWTYRQRWTITNGSDEPLFRYPVRISLGSTTALVTASKALASGGDVRVWLEGLEQSRTLVSWNTSASYVWLIIPALASGETLTYDVVYGNASAGTAPGLAYPDLPPFDLATSTNGLWVFLTNPFIANTGKGLWYLSSGAEGSVADYGVPGSWRPAMTFDNPNNTDKFAQPRANPNESGGSTWYQSQFRAIRAAQNTEVVLDSLGAVIATSDMLSALAGWSPFDGVAIHNPFGIVSVRTGFLYSNYTYRETEITVSDGAGGTTTLPAYNPIPPVCALVVLARNSGAERWARLFSLNTQAYTAVVIDMATYTPVVPVKHVGIALWPHNLPGIPSDSTSITTAKSNTNTEVTITTTNLGIALTTAEEQIYEIATELRLGGGAQGVAPYHALLIGNARGASGAGTPRCAITLTQALRIDVEARTHDVWNVAVTSKIEELPTHAVRAVIGRNDGEETVEFRASRWLPLAPPRTIVPNGDFAADLGSWVAGTTTANMTATRSWDGAVGGELNGSLKIAITPNTAGVNAVAQTIGSRWYGVHGRESVEAAAWVITNNANLRPRLDIIWYGDNNDTPNATSTETAWTPVVSTEYRRVFAARVPAGATRYRLGLRVQAATAGATGTVWADDITVNDNELFVADVAAGTLAIDVSTRGRWV